MKFNLNIKSSKIDTFYRSILVSKVFTQGWGQPEDMKKIFAFRKLISNRNTCIKLVNKNHPIYINKLVEQNDSYSLYEGHFVSPLVQYLPELIPEECKTARFQLLLPRKWKFLKLRPLCLHLAGTGDHYYWRRRNLMAKPLLKEAGIASIILENPFYGDRKPVDQKRSSLRNVSDIFIMGGCLILESLALLNWCERIGYGPFCVTGISMGGHMASLVGASYNKPISIVPCLSWTTASCAFTHGVLSEAIPWNLLESQYLSYGEDCRREMTKMLHSPEDREIFNAGRYFVQNFSNEVKNIEFNSSQEKEKSITSESLKLNTINFMKGIMDECTHLGNFSVPLDTDLVVIITASSDAYVPKDGLIPLTDIWSGSHLRILDCGHITAILFKLDQFREAIIDSLKINAAKYHLEPLKV